MKLVKKSLLTIVIGLMTASVYANEVSTKSPVGYWKTIDDVTGKPKSIVHIWETKNQVLMGKVIKIFPKEGQSQKKLCTACAGDQHNQPIVGLVILSGLKKDQQEWNKGHILDPENGKTYSCSAHIADDGKKLNVRGYIGIPLLGRSQLWERVDITSDSTQV